MGNKHYWVYIHINKKNGKRYVGITTMDKPEMRWGKNGSGYRHNRQPKFANAIKKYGWRGFDHIAVAVESEDKMLWMEKYLIQVWNTVDGGYNSTYGGEENCPSESTKKKMSDKAKERYVDPTNHPMYGKHPVVSEKRKLELSEAFSGENNPFFGKHHSEDVIRILVELPSIPILQFTKEGIFIREWSSATEVAETLGYNQARISGCCNNKSGYKYYKNCIWKKKSDCDGIRNLTPEEVEQHSINKNSMQLVQLSLVGEFVSKWRGLREVEKTLKLSRAGISKCCKHETTSYGNFRWMFLDEYLANGGVIA